MTQAWKVTGQPSREPITVDEARLHCYVDADNTEVDSLIDRHIAAARKQVENDAELSLITQTITLTLDEFPANGGPIRLPRPPVQSATIAYKDSAGIVRTLAPAMYIVETSKKPGQISLAYGQSWPATYGQVGDVIVTVIAGFGADGNFVPATLRQAMLLLIDDMYEHRARQIERVTLAENTTYWNLVGSEAMKTYS